jgi:signal transduction histidine kinase
MQANTRFLSIKSLFVWVVMAITTLTLVLASSISLVSQISNYKKEMNEDVNIYAELISRNAASSVAFNDNFTEEENLKGLAVAGFIENVHIYKLENEQLTFFASYNRIGIAPVSSMYNRIEELEKPKLTGGIFEVIKPIKLDNKTIGYIYLKSSAQSLDRITKNSIYITVIVLIASMVICFILTLKLQKSITEPIEKLVSLVQRIARQTDYSGRAEQTSIMELDILAESFNDMLDRTQEHIQGQKQAEEEQRKLKASLEEKVNQRTTALKEANQELIQTLEKLHQFQRQMVQNEKMASVGDMVAGVAHEVNTPIGLGVTASTMMLDRLNHLEKEFEGKALKASTLAKFIAEGQENLNIIYRNLNRAAELISSFKQVAVDQSSENSRVFSFSQLMDEILLSMRPKLKKLNHQINLHCREDLYIETKAGPINQIMINLIMNSIIHGFEFIKEGQIDISVNMISEGKIRMTYKDNGKGIPEHLRKRIFDPFVTTKRGQGGSGLGMHLVYNLVTQALNGSISITSEESLGVEFEIIFPVKQVDANTLARSS